MLSLVIYHVTYTGDGNPFPVLVAFLSVAGRVLVAVVAALWRRLVAAVVGFYAGRRKGRNNIIVNK